MSKLTLSLSLGETRAKNLGLIVLMCAVANLPKNKILMRTWFDGGVWAGDDGDGGGGGVCTGIWEMFEPACSTKSTTKMGEEKRER